MSANDSFECGLTYTRLAVNNSNPSWSRLRFCESNEIVLSLAHDFYPNMPKNKVPSSRSSSSKEDCHWLTETEPHTPPPAMPAGK